MGRSTASGLRPVHWISWLLGLAGVVAAVWAALTALLFFAQDLLIYPAPRGGVRDPADAGVVDAETFDVTSEDGTALHGWILFPPGPRDRRATALLVFHGNGENVTRDAAWLDLLRRLGLVVAAIDYRGYGLSSGKPSEAGLLADGRAAFDALRRRPEVDPDRILLLGSSLGSGVAIGVAEERPVAGVILQSPFDSLRRVAKRHYPIFPMSLVRSPFDSLGRIARVHCLVLFLHGSLDRIVPIEHGRALHARTPKPFAFHEVEGAGHNDLVSTAGPRYGQWIREFVDAVARR